MLSHQRASKRSHGRDTLGQKEKKITKTAIKFEFRWKHWCQQASTFKQKKKGSGGGTRVLDVPKVASADECLEMAKYSFFLWVSVPRDRCMKWICPLVILTDVVLVTLASTASCSLSLPSGICCQQPICCPKEKLPYDSGDEEDLMQPILPPRDAPGAVNGQSQLIGTSKEREEYRNQLERDLAASLQQDRVKEENGSIKKEERLSAINKEITRAEEEGAQLERLRLSHLKRVVPEAKEDKSFIVVREILRPHARFAEHVSRKKSVFRKRRGLYWQIKHFLIQLLCSVFSLSS